MSDTVATCLLDLTNISAGPHSSVMDMENLKSKGQSHTFHDLEKALQECTISSNEPQLRNAITRANELAQNPEYKTQVLRILWKAVLDAKAELADLIVSSFQFSFEFVDDINGRTYLHEAAIRGQLRLVSLCLKNGIEINRQDAYGRTALHYAAIHGHAQVCECLVTHASLIPDLNVLTPLHYAISYGHVDCVRTLLAQRASQGTQTDDSQPMFIACETGNKEIVMLLLSSGFKSEPNTNGEYPIHHAARKGHADLCDLLVNHKGSDVADKFNEWTPLFHAARYGHLACVDSLLKAGANSVASDEFSRTPAFYAAWYGHDDVLRTLLAASTTTMSESTLKNVVFRYGSHTTPSTSSDAAHPIEEDLDLIPSLSLPPPIMPFRSYGHNYLQSSHLIQISLGHDTASITGKSLPIRLTPRLVKRIQELPAEFAVKVVFTCKSETVAGPLSFTLPTTSGERPDIMFQLPDLNDLYLEISLLPSVGTKTIGKSIFLPSAFKNIRRNRAITSPLLDHHLHIIGEVSDGFSVPL
jgi:CDK inhibitor PHO81